jgi:hypothetical protein
VFFGLIATTKTPGRFLDAAQRDSGVTSGSVTSLSVPASRFLFFWKRFEVGVDQRHQPT